MRCQFLRDANHIHSTLGCWCNPFSRSVCATSKRDYLYPGTRRTQADATAGGTQELSEDNDILDEVAEGPLPQDDATAAEVETHETEATTDSAIHQYLKTVRESIQNEMKQHTRPKCYIRGRLLSPEETCCLCSL
jgi:hypothetical protein